jgi:hypothetical protein
MAEWQGIVTATAQKYLQGAADETIRKRLLLSLLKSRGRIKFNEKGTQCAWDVQFSEQPIEAYGDMGQLVFDRHDLLRQLSINWRGYKATDMMSEKERLMNDGDVAIVNRYSQIVPTLMQAMNNKFSAELFVDGYAAGNGDRLHGLESFTGTGTTVAADRIAKPGDNYGGLSTAVQDHGGTWSASLATPPNASIASDWPDGNGDPEYDFLSPKLINWSSTNWGTGSTSWEDNCERCIRQAIIWTTTVGGKDGQPTMFLMGRDMYYPYLNKQEAKQRIIVPHREAEDLGFPGVMNQQGVMLDHDFDVPVNTAYGLNVNQMELASLDSVLFSSRGPEYDIKTDAYLFMVGFFGNARYRPKHFSKIKNFA